MTIPLSSIIKCGLILLLASLIGTFFSHAFPVHSVQAAQAPPAQPSGAPAEIGQPLAGTAKLTMQGDIASELVAGADRFLLKQIEAFTAARSTHWKRDLTSREKYEASIEANRQIFTRIIGLRDARVPFDSPELVATLQQPAKIAETAAFDVYQVRWPAFYDVVAEGLLLIPKAGVQADVIAIPDADQTPEQIAGIAPGLAPEAQYARKLAQAGCRVLVPSILSRSVKHAKLSNREYIYRPAFELGRHIIGYEVNKILAGVDWFKKQSPDAKVGLIGWGEGGLLAFYAAAVDRRIDAVCVSGYFDSRNQVWQEPAYRNIFGLLERFGDAEIAGLIAPRALIVDMAKGPRITVPPGTGGKPGRLAGPDIQSAQAEFERAKKLTEGLAGVTLLSIVPQEGDQPCGPKARESLLAALGVTAGPAADAPALTVHRLPDARARDDRQLQELDRHNQWLLAESPALRQKFMSKLQTKSIPEYEKSLEFYRDYFSTEVVGRFDLPRLPANPRTRLIADETTHRTYEVVLDVHQDLFAYGLLLVPKGIKEGEKRPVVVCQHGLEGRPQDVIGKPGFHYYSAFATELAKRGFVTFAPQHLYIFTDRFRTLQFKANAIKKTLFSMMVPQHEQITDWLAAQPFVDADRIGFYGLSYGGKSAMRIPPLVKRYCLSICSADFNEWVWKNASTRSRYSYVWTGEYEIFEFDLGSTFNYSEMAALIAPRPFMVERGHFDGVAPDETVAYEFAKVRHLYAARLGIGDRCELEWFVGPHSIHGKGTFDFLHRHLKWPAPAK